MADIAIVWDQGCGSLQLNGADLLTDDSLLTAVLISLLLTAGRWHRMKSLTVRVTAGDGGETVFARVPLAPVCGFSAGKKRWPP